MCPCEFPAWKDSKMSSAWGQTNCLMRHGFWACSNAMFCSAAPAYGFGTLCVARGALIPILLPAPAAPVCFQLQARWVVGQVLHFAWGCWSTPGVEWALSLGVLVNPLAWSEPGPWGCWLTPRRGVSLVLGGVGQPPGVEWAWSLGVLVNPPARSEPGLGVEVNPNQSPVLRGRLWRNCEKHTVVALPCVVCLDH